MSEGETSGGSFPNRQYYMKAALLGGGVSALLSIVPIVNWLNMFFLCLVIAGGTVAVYWVQQKTKSVEALEGAAIGALAGVVCGLFVFGIGFCLASGFALVILPEMSRRESREFTMLIGAGLTGSCCFAFTVYPMFSALGGLIGALIWPPDKGDATPALGADGAPLPPGQKPEPTPEEVAKRKKMIRIVLGTLGGCFGLMFLFCGVCGYLAYLESRDPDDTAGQDEIVSAPVVVGERVVVEIPAGSFDSARYGIWLVADDDLPDSLYSLTGRIGCRQDYGYGSGRDPYLHSIYTYRGPDDSHGEWLYLDSEFTFGGDAVTCHVEIETLPEGVHNPRIVVTKVNRPSDWF